MNNEFAKIAKICFELGVTVKSIKNQETLMDIISNFSNGQCIVFSMNPVSEDSLPQHYNARIVICGSRSTDSFDENFTYIGFPIKRAVIVEIVNSLNNDVNNAVCADSKMKTLLEVSKKVALSSASILITGESGTGKEVITKFIHQNSNRAKNSFVAVNCAAIPENLLESELFGHERGAFTGALLQRIGKFEEAHNGTLFLDEISEMSLGLQAKLLRAVQEKEITRLGGNNVINVNCRIIASSNRDLKQFVLEGKFREDLYYRLNVICIEIPPLRERKQDIVVLAEHFIKKYAKQNDKPIMTLSEEAIKSMLKYDWPGNVRELENVIHRTVILEQDLTIKTLNGISTIDKSKKEIA